MTTADAARRESDLRFESEALPWMDDVYRFALSLTRNAADADDLVQETFLRAYRSWHTFEPGSDARRWLFTICRNAFLRSLEKGRHETTVEEGDAESIAAARSREASPDGGQGALLSRIDLAPAISGALAGLQEPYRSAVVLVDVEDQSYEAAATVLGVPIGTVRSRLFRGRRLLQEALLTYARDAGIVPPPRDLSDVKSVPTQP